MAFATQQDVKEDNVTRSVESRTAKIPSIGYLGLAIGSMGLSAILAFGLRRKELANFVGLWAPTILIMGLYNKLVKIEHEDLGRSQSSGNVTGSQQFSSSGF